MGRVRNKLQDKYEFSCAIELRVSDFNYVGHVGNSQLIGLAHEARIKLLKQLGASEQNLCDGKTGLVIADITANFKAEVFPGEIVSIKSHVGEMGEAGFRIFHCITANDKTAALVETGIVAFDYQTRQRAKVPDVFLRAFSQYKKLFST